MFFYRTLMSNGDNNKYFRLSVMRNLSVKRYLASLIVGVTSLFICGCQNNSEYVGEVQTYWVNSLMITDYYKDIKCAVYRNKSKHYYEIDYEGTKYELVRDIPLDVNGDGSLILLYRFKNFDHYIEAIPE